MPVRAVEAMHWDMGREEICRRANSKPWYLVHEGNVPNSPTESNINVTTSSFGYGATVGSTSFGSPISSNTVEGGGSFGANRIRGRGTDQGGSDGGRGVGAVLPSVAEFEKGVAAYAEGDGMSQRRATQAHYYEEEGDDEENFGEELEREMRFTRRGR